MIPQESTPGGAEVLTSTVYETVFTDSTPSMTFRHVYRKSWDTRWRGTAEEKPLLMHPSGSQAPLKTFYRSRRGGVGSLWI